MVAPSLLVPGDGLRSIHCEVSHCIGDMVTEHALSAQRYEQQSKEESFIPKHQ